MPSGDSGVALLGLLIAIFAGIFIAFGASFFVVSVASNATPAAVDAPLVTYDAQ